MVTWEVVIGINRLPLDPEQLAEKSTRPGCLALGGKQTIENNPRSHQVLRGLGVACKVLQRLNKKGSHMLSAIFLLEICFAHKVLAAN